MSGLFDILLRNGYDSYVLTRSLVEESIREENNAVLEGVLEGLISSNALENYTIQNIQPDADVNQIVNNSIMTQNITGDGREVDNTAVRSLFNNSIVLQKFATIVNETVTETKYLRETVVEIEERERIVRQMIINPLFRTPYIIIMRKDDGSMDSITGYTTMARVKVVIKTRLNAAVDSGLISDLSSIIPSRYVRAEDGRIGSGLNKFSANSLIPSTLDRLVINTFSPYIGIYYFNESYNTVDGTEDDIEYFKENTEHASDISTKERDEQRMTILENLIGSNDRKIKKLNKQITLLRNDNTLSSFEVSNRIQELEEKIEYLRGDNSIQGERLNVLTSKYDTLRGN